MYIIIYFNLSKLNRIELFLACVGKMWGKFSTFAVAF
jgi:hypothetical protein